MAQKSLSTIVDDVEVLLDDGSNVIWSSTTIITPAVQSSLREISIVYPQKASYWATARHYSKNVNVSGFLGLLKVNSAVYPVSTRDSDGDLIDDGDFDKNRRNIRYTDANTIRLVMDNAPKAYKTDLLTGTVTFTSGDTAITGVGTAFTTELRAGNYIMKSTGNEWYRIASITSDTVLVLGRACVAADTGADTEDLTIFWRNDVVLSCDTEQYLTSMTDIAGAIDLGTGYTYGSWMIHVDALGTGTVPAGTLLNIAGSDTTYRVTADATIGTNECDIYIEPALQDTVPDNAVVTFRVSSLTPALERILTEMAAADVVINHASTAFDALALIATDITNADTEYKLANPEVDQAVADADSGRALVNSVPEGGGMNDYLNLLQGVMTTANGYLSTAVAALNQAKLRINSANLTIALRNLGHERKQAALRELHKIAPHKYFESYQR